MNIVAVPYFMGDPMPGFQVPRPHEVLAPDLPAGKPQQRMAVLYRGLADIVASTPDPVVYAGDCVSTIGVLAGLERRDILPTLIFFDAHGDFNTWETTPSGFIGGMPLAMLTGRGEQTIVAGAGLTPLADDRVLLVDGRDLDPGEDKAVAQSGITVTTVDSVAHSIPPSGPLYVHVDGDVVDPGEMPAMNYPAPDGPSLDAVRMAMIHLATTGRVVAFSISSWNPSLPGADIAAAAMLKLAEPFIAMP
ncbi:MAG: arginase family protein [Acidimicrobiia bacterium]|nr:arginase family protein [Acidimicrobiia bacterium]